MEKIINFFKRMFRKKDDIVPLHNKTYTFVKVGEWGILIERVK
jgi:hypothetical protein